MKPLNFTTGGLKLAVLALAALIAGSCDFGNSITAKNGTEVEGLTGTLVVAVGGSPAVGAWVRVYPAAPSVLAKGASGAEETGESAFPAIDSIQTASSGSFQFKDLPDGTYNIAATLQHGDTSFAMFLSGIVVVGNTSLGVDTLHVAGAIELQALSGSTTIANALCAIPGSPWQAVSDASGTCLLTGLPPGSFQITVTHPSYSITISGDVTVQSNLLTTAGILELIANSSPLPPAPLLVSPASLDTVSSFQPALIWRRVGNATSYHVQVSTDSVFTSLILNDSGRVDTSRATTALSADTRYYWRARAKNPAGVSPWSARWSFLTPAPVVQPGEFLMLVASQDGGIIASAPSQPGSGTHAARNFGKLPYFGIGTYDMNTVGRGLVRFSLPAGINSSDINRAVIRLYSYDWIQKLVQGDSVRVNLHRMLRDWKEGTGAIQDGVTNSAAVDGVTGLERMWGTQNGSEDWSQKLVGLNDIDASSSVIAQATRRRSHIGYWEFDVTALAKAWADQPDANFGVLLAGIIPPGNAQTEDYPAFYTREAAVPDSLKPVLILNGGIGVGGNTTPAPKLVAHWDFNEGAGTALTDRTGKGHTGTIQGGTWVDGIEGKALSFNGTSSRVVVPFTPDLNMRQFTLSAWVRTSLVDGQAIISRQTPAGQGAPWNYRFAITEAAQISTGTILAGRALADFWPSDDAGVIGNTLVADGTWHHLTAVTEGTTLKMYLDGALHATKSLGQYPDTTSTQDLWIGASVLAGWYFQGLIDEVRLYNGSLSATQVDSLYSLHAAGTGLPVTLPSPPAAPVLVSPAQWDNGIPNPPTLAWNAANGATSYHVQLAADSLFTSIIISDSGVTGTSRIVDGLLYSTEYHWRVRARNASGTGAWSTTFRFMTITGGPTVLPSPIIILEPIQGAVNVPRQSLVSWTGGSGTMNLKIVQVALDSAFTQLVTNDSSKTNGYYTVNAGTGSSTGRTMGILAGGTTHFVRVILGNDAGVRVSETRRFTTVADAGGSGELPTPVNLVAPVQGAANVPREPMVRFDGGSGTIKLLVVQVALDSAFTQLVTNDSDKYGGSGAILNNEGTGGSYGRSMGTLAGGTTHFVRVIIGNDAGVRVSETRRFTTVNWIPLYSNTTNALNTVVWNGSTYVAAGAAGTVLTSPDGVVWTHRTSGTTSTLFGAASNGNLIVVVGAAGTIRTSSDNGTSWTARTPVTTNNLHAVSWNGNQFVAGGAGGTLLTSVDGINWAARTSGTTSGIYAIAWTGSSHVITGANGTIRTSPDAVSWTARTSGVTGTLYALSWAGNVLTAAGADGVILTSSNGTTWTPQVSGVTSALYSLAWNGTRRVAVGANGIALTSSSGTVWSRDDFGVPEGMYAATSKGSTFLAVGQAGRIMTVP